MHTLRTYHSKCVGFLWLCMLVAGASYGEEDLSIVFKRVSDAVVRLASYDANGTELAQGTGFLVAGDGLLVSNYHVVKKSHVVVATLINGDRYTALGIVHYDRSKDFVVLKIPSYRLPAVDLGDSDDVQVGQSVFTVGNPRGLDLTVSTGIISQIRSVENYRVLQTTAPISPGSSGGPLFTMKGRVIGITTATLQGSQNLNFALPINYVRGALSSNPVVRHDLAALANYEIVEEERLLEQTIASLFTVYEDPQNFFSVLCPKTWQVHASRGWDTSQTTYSYATMLAPPEAQRANVDGHLSEGMRIIFRFPPNGNVWTMDSVDDWGPVFVSEVLEANPGFAHTSESSGTIGEMTAKVYSFVGQNRNIREPEVATFIVVAGESFRLTIELVSPVTKSQQYSFIHQVLMRTLELHVI